jgi:CDP-diacylglycerol--serine O-phosphatidyltransferase
MSIWPLLLTAGNLIFGFLAVGLVTLPQTMGWGVPQLEAAVWSIVLAGTLDAIDGPVARRVGSRRVTWGREFDALADLVSFGVAPAVLIGVAFPVALNWVAIAIGTIYIMAGAWRLARFLQEAPGVGPGRFQGMPITAGGLTLAAFWLFEHSVRGGLVDVGAAVGLVLICSILMVSRIVFDKFPEFGLRNRRNRVKWVIVSFCVAAIAVKATLTGLPIALLYVAHGPIRALFRLRATTASETRRNATPRGTGGSQP